MQDMFSFGMNLFLYMDRNKYFLAKDNGVDQTNLSKDYVLQMPIPVLPLAFQKRIVYVLDNFDEICSDLKIGLPAEMEKRQQQYEYYRDKLLDFNVIINKDINITGGAGIN